MSFDSFLERNRRFAHSPDRPPLLAMPDDPVLILTCADPRVEPATLFGYGIGRAIVLRNTGGRVTDAVISDIAMLSQIGEYLLPDSGGAALEVAVVHHTHCGTAFLADAEFRGRLARRVGVAETSLADHAVTDPLTTVGTDVDLLLRGGVDLGRIAVSGHVLDLETGLVTTVRPAVQAFGTGLPAVAR